MGDSFSTESHARKQFIGALATVILSGCAGGGMLVPGRRTQNVCPTDAGQRRVESLVCGGGGGTGGYTATGGIDGSAYTNFRQYTQSNGKLSLGWNNSLRVDHGGNDTSGKLQYTGSAIYSSSSTSFSSNHSYQLTNGPAVNVTATIPAALPSQGTYSFNGGTISNDAANNVYTANFTVQGVPCSLTQVATDSTQQNFRYDYKNLNTGFIYSWHTSLQVSLSSLSEARHAEALSHAACTAIAFAGIVLGATALLAACIALPEAVAGEADAVAMDLTVKGMSAAAVASDVLAFVGCPQ